VVSSTVPSTVANPCAVVVDPLDVDSMVEGLLAAAAQRDDAAARQRRRDSVAGLSWANCARDHVAAWR
jgi:hypothetical protein